MHFSGGGVADNGSLSKTLQLPLGTTTSCLQIVLMDMFYAVKMKPINIPYTHIPQTSYVTLYLVFYCCPKQAW